MDGEREGGKGQRRKMKRGREGGRVCKYKQHEHKVGEGTQQM